MPSKNRSNIKTVFVLLRPQTLPFVTKAAESAGVSSSSFARSAIVAAAEKELGKKAPEAEAFSAGGRMGLISQAAAKAGLTVAQLKNKLATEALGGKWTAPAPSKKRSKK